MNRFLTFLPWVLLIVFVGFYWYERNKGPGVPKPAAVSVNTNVPIEETFTDKQGNLHTIIKDGENVISKSEFKNPNRAPNFIDTTGVLQYVAANELIKSTKITTRVRDSLLKAQKVIDALTKRLAFVYNDNFVKLKFTPPIDSLDTGKFDFQYDADLTVTQYQRRKWFLGQKKSYIAISSTDPRTTIRGVKQLTVEQETPQFGLRLQGYTNFNPQNNAFGFGPAVRLDLGRFSFQGNYTYYPESGRWRPGVTGTFDLIRF